MDTGSTGGGAGEQLCFKSSGFSLEIVFIPRFIGFHNALQDGEKFVHASDEGDLFGIFLGEPSFIKGLNTEFKRTALRAVLVSLVRPK